MNIITPVNIYKIVLISLFISLSLYAIILSKYLPIFIDSELSQFRLIISKIDEQKRTTKLVGLLIESKLEEVDHNDARYGQKNFSAGFYSTLNENGKLTKTEHIIATELHNIFSHMPDLVENPDYLMFYRSNEGQSILLAREMPDFQLNESFFDEQCMIHLTCSTHASFFSLNDKLLISPIYHDLFTKKSIITVSTPIYYDGRLLGDISMDIYLDKYSFLNHKDIKRIEKGVNVVTHIKDPSYPLYRFSYTEEYKADNRNIFVYDVPLSKLIFSSIWILFALFSGMFFLFWKLQELKLKDKRLIDVELVVNKDELTGLYNRSVLTEVNLLSRVEMAGAAVIAIDGDKLKSINDNYGHHVGDEAIRHIAFNMNITFRESDYLIRTGGDEFLAILPGCSYDTAEELATRLQKVVEEQPFSINSVTVGVSTGVTITTGKEPLINVIKRADSLLYADKLDKYNQ